MSYWPTDGEVEAAQIAEEEYIHGHQVSTPRDLRIRRYSMYAALVAANEYRERELPRIEAAVEDVLRMGSIPEPITDFEMGYSNAMGLVQSKLRAAKEGE